MNTNLNALTDNDLFQAAPAIYAHGAHPSRVSDRYAFYSTSDVLDVLRKEGWHPTKAVQARVRRADRRGFQRHLVRFQRDDRSLIVNGSVPELLLSTAHDGSASFQLQLGVWRFICGNGLVAGSVFDKVQIRHVGYKPEQVISASHKLLASLPRLANSINEMTAITLSPSDRLAFAEVAIKIRYEDQPAPIRADQLLTVRRTEDREPTLYNTFQTVQENIIRGGLRGITQDMRRTRTRGVSAIAQDLNINAALWGLAASFKPRSVSQSMAEAA